MEDGAMDLHTKHRQIRIVTADGTVVVERRIVTRPDQFAAVFEGRDPLRILLESSTEKRVGRDVPGRAGPRGGRGRSELRRDVWDTDPSDQDGPARCGGAG